MRLLFRFALVFALFLAIGDVAHADQLASPDTPQSLAALWPMLVVAIVNLAGVAIPRLSSDVSYFHTTAGKAALTVVGAFISAIPSAIQAHGLCWAMLAWAALGCVGTLTSAMSTTAKSAATALLSLLLLPTLLATGCATAEKDTMLAELGLGSSLSLGYRTIDGVDKMKVDSIRAELEGGDVAKAKADYAAYKPKIEKARASLNTAEDTLENAEKERQKIPTGGDTKQWTAWLPALSQAAVSVEQIIADVKGLVQK